MFWSDSASSHQFLPAPLFFPFPYNLVFFFLNPSSPICVAHTIFPAWHFRGLWLTYQGPQSWGKVTSLSLKLSIANSFLAMGGILSPLPLSTLGFWAAWACVGLTHTALTSVHLYVQLPCCEWKTLFSCTQPLPLALRLLWSSLLQLPLSFGKKGCAVNVSLELSIILCTLASSGLGVNHHLLQKKKKKHLWWGSD